MEDLKKIQEFFSKPLNEVSGNIDIEDFAKVVQAISQTDHPVTVLLTPMFGKNEIELVIGMDAPDPIGDAMFDIMTDLGYQRGDYSIVGDTSTLSRREYSQIRRINGGHKNYRRFFEESVNEAQFTDYSNKELAAYCKNNPTDKKAAKELHKRSQALKGLTRTDEAKIEVDDETEFKLDLKHLLDKHVVEATKEEETEFHAKLDKLVHDTFGKRKGELEERFEMSWPGKYVVRPCSNPDTPFAVWQTSEGGKNDKRIEGFKTKEEAQSFADRKNQAAYIAETIKLGLMVNEELCDKGKRYIKARQAAGEKSSAYLSGRAVRVCKGQIEWPKKGKKKK